MHAFKGVPLVKKLPILLLTAGVFAFSIKTAIAKEDSAENTTQEKEENKEEIEELESKIKKYEKKLGELQDQRGTLQSEIDYLDNQMYLTQLRIQNVNNQIYLTTEKIAKLGEEIDDLNTRLDRIANSIDYQEELLNQRQREQYKSEQAIPKGLRMLLFLLQPTELERKIQINTYSQVMQEKDKDLLDEMEKTKKAYTNQKDIFEDKKEEEERLKAEVEQQKISLEDYKNQLDGQKEVKERLLRETQNDENRYQALLDQARQEYISIQAILQGAGIEESGLTVKAGQAIGSVISGASCNSNGTHLHFTIRKKGETKNPLNYLRPITNYSNCSGAGSCSPGDSFNPQGDWEWPLKGHVTMHQGYGNTWAIRNLPWLRGYYTFHDGIDISSTTLTIYAVENGIYYRGYYETGYCKLQYIKIEHADNVESFYLHVNY